MRNGYTDAAPLHCCGTQEQEAGRGHGGEVPAVMVCRRWTLRDVIDFMTCRRWPVRFGNTAGVVPGFEGLDRQTSYAAAQIGANISSSARGPTSWRFLWPHFVVLASFSDQGIKNVKQTIERADAFKEMSTK